MQVNQNVNAANFMQIGSQTNAAGQMTKTDTANEGQDFASFLKPASEKKEQAVKETGSVSGSKAQEKTDNVKKDSARTDNAKSESASAEKTQSENPSEKTKEDTGITSNKPQDSSSSEPSLEEQAIPEGEMALTEEETEVLLETVGQLLQNVMNQFDLTPKELTDKLESFGMEEAELLTPDGVKTFFLNMQEAEPADLLVNEELNNQLNDFANEMDKMIETLDVPLETVRDFLKDNDFVSVVAETAEQPVVFEEEQVTAVVHEDVDDKEFLVEDSQTEEEPEVVIKDNRQPVERENNQNPQNPQNNQQPAERNNEMTETKTEHKAVHMENKRDVKHSFENPILQAINESINNIAEPVAVDETQVSNRQIIEQIVEQVRVEMNQSSTSLEMQLYPEHLGKIQIQVVSKDGAMTARIAAETEAAKQAIESGLTNLKEAMEQQNIKVEAIEVMVSTTGFGQSMEEQNTEQQQGSAKSGGHGNLSGIEEEEAEEDTAEAEKMRAVGSSVSYTA